jgi:hypothetical protein
MRKEEKRKNKIIMKMKRRLLPGALGLKLIYAVGRFSTHSYTTYCKMLCDATYSSLCYGSLNLMAVICMAEIKCFNASGLFSKYNKDIIQQEIFI